MATPLYNTSDWSRTSGVSSDEVGWRKSDHRDYARVIHSACFRRLQGKTQLFPTDESDFFRNRLTHSLEVAQIAEAIAVKLNSENAFLNADPLRTRLCSVAGLMHDLGHPPFGHNGERALNEKMKGFGGFEGNAQTLRIISRLEKKAAGSRPEGGWDTRLGLDLSFRTIASVLKYDTEIPEKPPEEGEYELIKGYYFDDAAIVSEVKNAVVAGYVGPTFKTIECAIMDIADDIAYSTYDLEDSFQAGFLTPIDMLSCSDALRARVARKVTKEIGTEVASDEILQILTRMFDNIVSAGEDVGPFPTPEARDLVVATTAYKNSQNLARSSGWRTEFTSELVGELVNAVHVEILEDTPQLSKVKLADEALLKVATLKHFSFEAMISAPRVQVAEYRGKQIVEEVFDALASPRGNRLLPPDAQELHIRADTEASKLRVICDFIAGMTDRYALEFYARLRSTSAETIFKPL